MRTLSVFPESAIAGRVVDLLLGSISIPARPVWVVSPWITDFEVDLRARGLLLPQLGFERTSIRLGDLLKLCARWNQVSVVVRPPHVLFGRGDLVRLVDLLQARATLLADKEPALGLARPALALLESETERIVTDATSHRDTIRFVRSVAGERNITVHFNPRLHGKILVTPAGALAGSANLTWSGMNSNDEVMLEVSEPDEIEQLHKVAEEMASRTFCQDARNYDFLRELSIGERLAVDALLANPVAPSGLAELLRECLGSQA